MMGYHLTPDVCRERAATLAIVSLLLYLVDLIMPTLTYKLHLSEG